MARVRLRRSAAAVGIATFACLLISPQGKAEVLGTIDDLTYVEKSAALENAGANFATGKRVTASCPAGTEPAGGGTGVSGNPLRSYVMATGPGEQGWESTGWHFDSPQAEVTSWGICTSQLERFRVKSATLAVASETASSASVPCGGAGAAVSGGIRPAGRTGEWWLSTSAPRDGDDADDEPDDLWSSSVYHRAGYPLRSVTFDVICREGPLPTYEAAGVAFSTLRKVTTRVKCPGRKSVVGGGPDASGLASDVHVSRTGPIDLNDDDEIPDDGWSATFANPAGGEHDFVVYATCI